MASPASPELFVLNVQDSALDVVHLPRCSSIAHQVRGDTYEVLGGFVYEILGKDEAGRTIFSESRDEDAYARRVANYVTVEQLLARPRRCRRCAICAPNVPDSPVRPRNDHRTLRAVSLRPSHIGREFAGLGVLDEYRVTSAEYVLISGERSLRVAHDGELEYLTE